MGKELNGAWLALGVAGAVAAAGAALGREGSRATRSRSSMTQAERDHKNPKALLKEDSDEYFAQHVRGKISKKSLTDYLKGTGFKPRGKGYFDKKRGFVELYLDNPESRSLPLRVVFSGSHYTKGDGKGYVLLESPYYGNIDDVFNMTGDPDADAMAMHSALNELLFTMVEYDTMSHSY